MHSIPLLVVVAYLGSVTLIGSLLARRTTSSGQWAVAGSEMGPVLIAVGIAGTRIGGAATYGVAGDVIHGGVWTFWWFGINTFLALALVGRFFAVPYRRLRIQTVGEIFWVRDRSRRNQALASLCAQAEYLVVNIIEAYVIATILRSLTGLPMMVTVAAAAFILISYTALGGLWGAAVTNLVHSAVIIVGLLAVVVMGFENLGGWAGLTGRIHAHLAAAGMDETRWWSFTGGGWGAILGMFFAATIHTPAASIYVNFSTAAKSERIVFPSFLLAAALASVMPVLAGVVGMETLAKYGFEKGLQGYSNITKLPMELNPWIGAVALAAILAAVVSSGGPVLLSSATMFVRDWLLFTRSYAPEQRLRAYRMTTVLYGLVAAAIAWLLSLTNVSILELLLVAYAAVVPPAVAVGYIIYWRRTTEAGAFWGMAAGFAGGLLWYGWIHARGGGLDPSYVTTLIPLGVIPLVSCLTPCGQTADGFYAALAARSAPDAAAPE